MQNNGVPSCINREVSLAPRTRVQSCVRENHVDQHVDGAVFFDGVAQVLVVNHMVPIAATDAFALDVASLFQVLNDGLHGSFRDPHPLGEFAKNHLRILIQANQNMGVVRKKSPAGWLDGLVPV